MGWSRSENQRSECRAVSDDCAERSWQEGQIRRARGLRHRVRQFERMVHHAVDEVMVFAEAIGVDGEAIPASKAR